MLTLIYSEASSPVRYQSHATQYSCNSFYFCAARLVSVLRSYTLRKAYRITCISSRYVIANSRASQRGWHSQISSTSPSLYPGPYSSATAARIRASQYYLHYHNPLQQRNTAGRSPVNFPSIQFTSELLVYACRGVTRSSRSASLSSRLPYQLYTRVTAENLSLQSCIHSEHYSTLLLSSR